MSTPSANGGVASDMLTSGATGYRRLKVDVAQTGFFEGREFRTFVELNIPSGQSVWLRFTAPLNFILFEQALTIDSGAVRFTAIVGGAENSPFTAQLPVIGKNRMSTRRQPFYVPQCTIDSGGSGR